MKLFRKWLLRMVLAVVVLTAMLVLPLRWVDPPTSAFMLRDRLIHDRPIDFRPVVRDHISPHLFLAVIASEDQNFPNHWGFDGREIRRALEDYQQNRPLRGASTITQQLAKNLYLWPGQSWLRKGVEAWFTVWLEVCLPKRRILDIYLNIVELDDGVYGAEAGARHYFGRSAMELTQAQAALLAAVLPAPKRYNAFAPDAYLQQRQQWILGQMDNLGEAWVP
ncbi:MAG: monofunctional biosynthetic peptidoglycan transglycosylase [Gammaproteobacteria bacterium HGW-Gammaproteobacteria-8]|nr:MAG: monofunctional biosynthetic peptidoglycan transglycosylase [Gammaproteobacteria bacterium HGW-Gammaproteobacteria-8]